MRASTCCVLTASVVGKPALPTCVKTASRLAQRPFTRLLSLNQPAFSNACATGLVVDNLQAVARFDEGSGG
jgi:hypothetical protein